jgi:hypothetical protein
MQRLPILPRPLLANLRLPASEEHHGRVYLVCLTRAFVICHTAYTVQVLARLGAEFSRAWTTSNEYTCCAC